MIEPTLMEWARAGVGVHRRWGRMDVTTPPVTDCPVVTIVVYPPGVTRGQHALLYWHHAGVTVVWPTVVVVAAMAAGAYGGWAACAAVAAAALSMWTFVWAATMRVRRHVRRVAARLVPYNAGAACLAELAAVLDGLDADPSLDAVAYEAAWWAVYDALGDGPR